MAITDINISEELITNAPSIRYKGEEGPKSPEEEMMMASAPDPMDERNIVMEAIAMEEFGKPLRLLNEEEIIQIEEMMMEMTGGQPLPEDPTKPVNPFQPKPIGPLPDKRQMAAFGGIMGVDGRRRYGIGSKLKKGLRKLIPNELADIAVTAAPFVAPFNPLAAGLMSGLGSFDQTGKIGSSLKSGLLNYGLGQGARYLGGADFQGMPKFLGGSGIGGNYGFSMPTGEGGIKNLFKDKASVPIKQSDGTYKMSTFTDDFAPSNEVGNKLFKPTSTYDAIKEDQLIFKPENLINKTAGGELKSKIMEYVPTSLADLTNVKKLIGGAGIVTAATMLLGGGEDETVSAIMDRGEGMDVAAIRAEVQAAFADKTGQKLAALRVKYPYLGRADTKDMAEGGRIGFSSGSSLAKLLAGKSINSSSRRFLEKVFGKQGYENIVQTDPEMHRGMLEVVEMFRKRDKEGLKIYLQKFLPHMDDEMIEDFIVGSGGSEGIQGQLIRLGSGRDYAGKIDMIKKAENMRKLDALDVDKLKPNANGGRIRKQEGGLMDLGGMEKDYRNTGGFVNLGAKEKADDVPARLSVNEFVFTADAVRNAGGGDIDKGAEIMENMMKHLEQGGQVSEESQGMAGAQQMFETSERLSEVM